MGRCYRGTCQDMNVYGITDGCRVGAGERRDHNDNHFQDLHIYVTLLILTTFSWG